MKQKSTAKLGVWEDLGGFQSSMQNLWEHQQLQACPHSKSGSNVFESVFEYMREKRKRQTGSRPPKENRATSKFARWGFRAPSSMDGEECRCKPK